MTKTKKHPATAAAPRQDDKVEIVVGVVIGILILITWIVTVLH